MSSGLLKRVFRALQANGVIGTLRIVRSRILNPETSAPPLANADRSALFASSMDEVRARERQQMRATALMAEASQVETTYPLVFERNGRIMRYAFLPATGLSRGLIVLFHGHDAYLHLGPVQAFKRFDVLAPWDTFGWRRQGSWFWGEKGDNFVEQLVQALIRTYRTDSSASPWFCMGGSMGGFAALYHGIKYGCNGIYVTCPQIDLRQKVKDYGQENLDNPYGHLQGATLETVPSLLDLAEGQKTLPPLFLVQHQYDQVNYFADHGFRLLDVYNRKNAWYGIRVYPAAGHGGDASDKEADLFFSLILDKDPPHFAPFRTPQ